MKTVVALLLLLAACSTTESIPRDWWTKSGPYSHDAPPCRETPDRSYDCTLPPECDEDEPDVEGCPHP